MPGCTVKYVARTALWVFAITMGISGCALAEGRHAYAGPAASDEAGVFRALVAHYQETVQTPLRIDPRPVRYDANLNGIEADDFVAAPGDRSGTLNAVLRERGVEAADAIRDWRCVFTIGPPAVPGDTLCHKDRPECGTRAYTSVVFSVPEKMPRAVERGGLIRVRALTMTLSSYAIWNIELSRDASGVWKVERAQREFVIWS